MRELKPSNYTRRYDDFNGAALQVTCYPLQIHFSQIVTKVMTKIGGTMKTTDATDSQL